MLPGKKYTPEDILNILRRRFWYLIVPFAVIAAGTAVIARKLPDTYRSQTVLQVTPQTVPESYVKSTVTQPPEERLASITAKILVRARLERIIQEFNLYQEERENGLIQDVIELMLRDISIQPGKGDTFLVAYRGRDRRTVQKVAEKLGSMLLEENLRDRESVSQNTDQFLESEVEDARRQLLDQEKKVQDYRKEHAGELPDQLVANQNALDNTQQAIRDLVGSLDRDSDRRLILERAIGELEVVGDLTPANDGVSLGPDGNPTGGTVAQQLEYLRQQLAALRMTKTDQNPDVRRFAGLVAEYEKKAEAEALQAPVSGRVSANEIARRKRLADLRAELTNLDIQIKKKLAEEARLRGVAGMYQKRIEAIPTRDAELMDMTRDYQTLTNSYNSLREKKVDSKLAANLEQRQGGEQFRIVDAARMPEKPISPDRQQINLFGILAGLGMGLGLVALLEYRDQSFRTDDEVTNILSLPVLAVVPLMQSDTERKQQTRRRLIIGLGLGSTVLGCLAVLVYTFVR
jgi:polysaccharide chain length determinant protein (PEP-CTERM system associated)